MTATARDVLAAYDALNSKDKKDVAVEILRRSTTAGDLTNEGFDAIAADVFRGYDAEEAKGADH